MEYFYNEQSKIDIFLQTWIMLKSWTGRCIPLRQKQKHEVEDDWNTSNDVLK